MARKKTKQKKIGRSCVRSVKIRWGVADCLPIGYEFASLHDFRRLVAQSTDVKISKLREQLCRRAGGDAGGDARGVDLLFGFCKDASQGRLVVELETVGFQELMTAAKDALERAPTFSLNAEADDEYIRRRRRRIRARAKDAAKGDENCDEEGQLALRANARYENIEHRIQTYRARWEDADVRCEDANPYGALLPRWLTSNILRSCFGFATRHATNATIASLRKYLATRWIWIENADQDRDTALVNIEAELRNAYETSVLEVKALHVFRRQMLIAADCMSYAKVLTSEFVADRGSPCRTVHDWQATFEFLDATPLIELKRVFMAVMANVYFFDNQGTLRSKAIGAVTRAFETNVVSQEQVRTALERAQGKFATFLENLLAKDYGITTRDFLAAGRPCFGQLVAYAAIELHTNTMNSLGQNMRRRFRQVARAIVMGLQNDANFGGAFGQFLTTSRNRRERLVSYVSWRFIHEVRTNCAPALVGDFGEFSTNFLAKYPADRALEMTKRLKTEVEAFKLPSDGGASLFESALRSEFQSFNRRDWWAILDFMWKQRIVCGKDKKAPISAVAAFTAMSGRVCERRVQEMRVQETQRRPGAPSTVEELEKAIWRLSWEEVVEMALSRELCCWRRHGAILDSPVGDVLPGERQRRVMKAAIRRVITAAVRRELAAAGHHFEFGEQAAANFLVMDPGLSILTCARSAARDDDRRHVVDALGAEAKPKAMLDNGEVVTACVDVVARVASCIKRIMADAPTFTHTLLSAAQCDANANAKEKEIRKNVRKKVVSVVSQFVSLAHQEESATDSSAVVQDVDSALSPLLQSLNVLAVPATAPAAAAALAAPATPVTPATAVTPAAPITPMSMDNRFWIMSSATNDGCFPVSSLEYKFTRVDRTFAHRTMQCVLEGLNAEVPFFDSKASTEKAGNDVYASIIPPSLLKTTQRTPTFSGSINVSRIEYVLTHVKELLGDEDSEVSFVDITGIPTSHIVYVGIDPGINKPIASVIVAHDGNVGADATPWKFKFQDIKAKQLGSQQSKIKRARLALARRNNAAEKARVAGTCPNEAIATAKSTHRELNKKFRANRNKERIVVEKARKFIHEVQEFWRENGNGTHESDTPIVIIACGEEGIIKSRGWSQAPVSKYTPMGSAAMIVDAMRKIAKQKSLAIHFVFVPEYGTSRDCPSCLQKLSPASSGRVVFPQESNTRLVRPNKRNGRVCTNPNCNRAFATYNRDHIGSINMLKKYRTRLVEKLKECTDVIEKSDIAEQYSLAKRALESALTVFSLNNLDTREADQRDVEEGAEEETLDSDDEQAIAVDNRVAAQAVETIRRLAGAAAGEVAEIEARGVVRDRSGGGSRERAEVIRMRTSPDYPQARSESHGPSDGGALTPRVLDFDATSHNAPAV